LRQPKAHGRFPAVGLEPVQLALPPSTQLVLRDVWVVLLLLLLLLLLVLLLLSVRRL
jgi:hypothetical protein